MQPVSRWTRRRRPRAVLLMEDVQHLPATITAAGSSSPLAREGTTMPRNTAPRLRPLWPAGAALLAAAACAAQDADWAKLRGRMVEEQIKARGIKDERVLRAMATVPRH